MESRHLGGSSFVGLNVLCPPTRSHVSCPRAGSHFARGGPSARPVKGARRSPRQVSCLRSHVPAPVPASPVAGLARGRSKARGEASPGLMSQVSCPRAGSHLASGGPRARPVKGPRRSLTRSHVSGLMSPPLRHRDIEICGPPLRAPLTFARIRPVSSWAGPSKEARGDPVPFWIERKNE